jgi:hypothetical protein
VSGVVKRASFFIQPKWKWKETTKKKEKLEMHGCPYCPKP